jgi:sugar lactone lactonase YvrE
MVALCRDRYRNLLARHRSDPPPGFTGALITTTISTLVADGRYFEGPRWHAGRLYMVDSLARAVIAVAPDGQTETVCNIAGISGGMGVLRDGDLLVTSMFDRKLLRYRAGKQIGEIDLSRASAGTIDDMIVDARGRIYVGDLGVDLLDPKRAPDATRGAGRILLVGEDGSAQIVATGLSFPNGIAVSGDFLVVGESDGDCLSSFGIADDGTLRVHKRFGNFGEPDGVVIDSEGAIWVSLFKEDAFIRVDGEGRELQRIAVTGRRAVACALGGAERKTLFAVTAETTHEDLMRGKSHANLLAIDVATAGHGAP